MPTDRTKVQRYLRGLLEDRTAEELGQCLMPSEEVMSPRVAGASLITPTAVERRWGLLDADEDARANLLDPGTAEEMAEYAGNIENFIGTVKVPIGLVGPLRIRGLNAQGDYYVPLATTEAALVASCTRGAQLLSEAGGCTCAVVNEGVTRAPGFAFANVEEAGLFILWATERFEDFRKAADATSRHGRLTDFRITLEGNHVYLIFEYTTADASGQNMVTIATDAICRLILDSSPVKPRHWFVEANMSGDKKASVQSFQSVRGRKVTAEAVLPADLIEKRLHCTIQQLLDYALMSAMGGVMSGSIGVQGHYANALAGVYIACGQDAACVAESAVGVTRIEPVEEGVYAAVTLPALIVGTVGGGTSLPSQRACLEILGVSGTGHANAFAEVCAALALAGELSISGALAAGHFTRAHQRLARGKGQ